MGPQDQGRALSELPRSGLGNLTSCLDQDKMILVEIPLRITVPTYLEQIIDDANVECKVRQV